MNSRLQQHIENKAELRNTTAILKNGSWYRLVNGELITEKDFRKSLPKIDYSFPLTTKRYVKGDNPNSKLL